MKAALLTDTHFGGRGDSLVFAEYISKFYDEVFFPYLKKHNIKTVFHLGDIVDRRKFINFKTADLLYDKLIKPCIDNDIELKALIGNHDTYYKNTNSVNSMNTLFRMKDIRKDMGIHFFEGPQTVEFDDCKILLLPWICADNFEESMSAIRDTDATVCFGHLEIQGFAMYRNSIACYDGTEPSLFDKFELVCSGHFHHRSKKGNIQYLGSPYEMTWSDYNDPRGFHIFDSSTKELTFVQNPYKLFHKIIYNDSIDSREKILKKDFSSYANTYVKVVVSNKSKPSLFDQMLDKLYSFNPQSISITDDHHNVYEQSEEDILEETQDTMTIVHNYIEAEEFEDDFKKQVARKMEEFYHKAQEYTAVE